MQTVQEAIADYLPIVRDTRALKTYRTYTDALRAFVHVVGDAPLSVETYILFLRRTKNIRPTTQALYRSAVHGMMLHYGARHNDLNLAAVKEADRRYAQRNRARLPVFDRDAIERVIVAADQGRDGPQALRDRAFILTLADSGLRISEACALTRGAVDWKEGRAVIIGKGDRQAVVRFSNRALGALKDYLAARAKLDGGTGKPLASLPLFARHDKGAGKKVKPVKSGGMWVAVKHIAKGVNAGHIRIHDFRHYFVTMFYLGTNDVAATQEAARHSNQATTARYTHLGGKVDQLYDQVFNAR